jgi:ribonuclease G
MTEFGLVQITRQRIRQNILHRMSNNCPMCSGSGRVQSKMAFLTDIETWMQRFRGAGGNLFLRMHVNPLIKHYLTSGIINKILRLCIKYRTIIKLEVDETLPLSEFRFLTLKRKTDITEEYNN